MSSVEGTRPQSVKTEDQNVKKEEKKKDNDVKKNDDECSCTCCDTLKKHPLYPTVRQLLHWKDYLRSGLIFLSLNVFFYLITFGEYTLLSLLFYAFFLIQIISIGYTVFQTKIKGGANPLEERFKGDWSISKETLEQHMTVTHSLCQEIKDHVSDLVLCKKLGRSVKAVFVSYILSAIFGCFNLITLLWLGHLLAFAIPPVYELKKDEIDSKIKLACDMYKTYKDLAMEKLATVPVLSNIVEKLKSD